MSNIDTIRQAGVLTGRYATFKPEHGTPVRTSVGRPPFWRMGALPHSRSASPYGVFGNKSLGTPEEEEVAYRMRLADQEEELLAELADIAEAHPGKPLVLLCFEDTSVDYCHRQWLAAWLRDRFDIIVTEVPA